MGSYSFEIFHLALARLSKFNHHLIPVNKPRYPVMNCHRDGFMRVDENGGGSVNYEPNSFNGPVQLTAFDKAPWLISGDATRYNHRDGNDADNLFRLRSTIWLKSTSILHQMVNFHRDQADIICKVFCRCELLNLVNQLLAKFVSAKGGSLTH